MATKAPTRLHLNSPSMVVEVAPPEGVTVLPGEGVLLLVDVSDPERVDEREPKLVLGERLEVSLEGGWPWGFVHPMSTGTWY